MSNIETAIEEMIQTYVDEQDFVTGMTAEMYTDGEISDLRADMEGELGELQSRIEALEAKIAPAAEDESEEPLDAWLGPKHTEEPRPVNQIDWIMTTHGLIAGYDSKELLESYVRSVLGDQAHQAEMIIAMVLTTARNLINKKLEAES
jgi:BMFP domain-containing protein YqiC